MSRITSNEVQGLMEAYNAVYAPQELTEEQIWEEVETWVNSLVEEGYDLSDYTWEDMYEAYIEEQGGRAARPSNPALSQHPIAKAIRGELGQNINTSSSAPRNKRGGGTTSATRPQIGSLPPSARQVTQYPQGVSTGNASASRPTPAPAAARPAAPAPAARPAAPAPAAARPATPRPKPTPTTPKPDVKKGPTGMPLVGGIERRIPTSAELKAAQEKRAAQKSVASSFTSAPISGAPKYAPPAFNLKQSYDLYDVIKGHLLDEGYADTEEAAEAIMVSMSEDWKQSILEVSTPPHPVNLPPPASSPPPVNSLPKLTIPPSVPKEPKDKKLPKLIAPPPVPPAKIPPLPPVK